MISAKQGLIKALGGWGSGREGKRRGGGQGGLLRVGDI